jgi:peptidyl-prolyl cis-trans isomerase C
VTAWIRATAGRCARWVRSHPLAPAGRRARVAALVFTLLSIGAGTAVALDRIAAVPAGAAFRVGDTVVTEARLGERVNLLGALYGVTPPSEPDRLDQFRRDTAKAVAISEVLDGAARAKGIVIADKTANDRLDQLIETSYPLGRDAFVRQLGSIGVSQADVVAEVKRQLANTQLLDQVTGDVPTPTDAEVAQAYQQRRAEMVIPERRHLRNIVVAERAQADQVRAQLAGGADFAAVAGQVSLDDSTKGKGGDLGTLTRDQLEAGYADVAFAAAPNSVFGPVQTQHGWNVGRVLEVAAAVPLTEDQVREQLRASLLDQRKQRAWDSWLREELRSAHVRYADAYRPADPLAVTPPPAPAK